MRNLIIAAVVAIAAAVTLGSAMSADQIKADGKCWLNNNNTQFHWGDCGKESKHHKK